MTQQAVVLLNFGGPRQLDEVGPFIREILADPNTLQLPFPQWLQNRLAARIARRRQHEVAAQYAAIGGRSPIVAATQAVAEGLAALLKKDKTPLPVLAVHRYLPGSADQAARQLVELGVEELIALPMYPQFSWATSGSSFEQLAQALKAAGWRGRAYGWRSYPQDSGYLAAMAARLKATLERAKCKPQETLILCSAHGLPKAYVTQGDPYAVELRQSLQGLAQAFPGWRFRLSFQSRVGPAEWLKPYTGQEIPRLAQEGVKELVFLPLAFVNDHIETLYEIGHTYFALAKAHGLNPHLVPAVEDHPDYLASLAGAVARWRQGFEGQPLEALLPPPQGAFRRRPWVCGLALLAAFGLGVLWAA